MSTVLLVLPVLVVATVVAAAVRGVWSPCGLSMLSAMNPVAERGRGNRFALTVVWFVVGAVLGGAALGGVGGGLAALVDLSGAGTPARAAVVLAGGLLVLAVDRGAVPWARLPLVPRQVDETWLSRYRRWIYATGFGVQLGFGVATYVMTAAVGLVVVAGAVATPAGALALGVLFGVVRGLMLLTAAPVRGAESLARLIGGLERTDARALLAVDTVVALTVVAAAAVLAPVAGAVVAAALLVAALAARFLRRAGQPRVSATPGL